MKEQIKEFLASDEESMKMPMIPLSEVDAIVLDLGLGYEHHDFQQNGWQVDFWQTWRGDNYNQLILAGSLHYGDFTLSKSKY